MKDLAACLGSDELSDILQAVRFRGSVFCRSHLSAPWGFSVQGRDFATFHFLTRGSSFLEVEGVEGRLALSAGDLVILPLGDPHVMRDAPSSIATELEELIARSQSDGRGWLRTGGGGKPTRLVCGGFQFEDRRTNPLLAGLPHVIHLRGRAGGTQTWLRMALSFLAEEADSTKAGADAVMTRLADLVFIEALRTYFSAPDAQKLRLAVALREPRISTTLVAIHRQPEADWEVGTLARHAGMSRSAFAARFRELVGEPPRSYVTRCRMSKAAGLLSSSSATIAEIAGQVGYVSQVGFGRAFKACLGTTPAAYRQQTRRKRESPLVTPLTQGA